jgi:predicted nucleic acid-binding protein
LIAVDTSVVVAAFASWHEGHASAVSALARRPRLPAHVAVEAFSVLTRLPPPHRAPADLVERFLRERFPEPLLPLPAEAHRALLSLAVRAGLAGGAIYDALVAVTAKRASASLLTRDRRAAPTYEAVGVRYELLS